ncbi:unnamed protein product [Sphagnum troendelagicum]|uniref:G-patch domain-containing protein n=1 Tax=Sphagnum troendelagicum TaxID=128251 RepID=A0ABP0UZD3_9BRYO
MEHPVMFQGVAKDSPAFRLMTQMGWEEGKGLGKDKQGIKSHIRVRKPREEKSGWLFIMLTFPQPPNFSVKSADCDSLLLLISVPKEESDETSDDEVPEVNEVKVKKVSRPQGRYKRREGGKLVRGYSETDLKAILLQEEKVNTPPSRIQVREEINPAHEALAVDWWGTNFNFVRGGRLGSTLHKPNAAVGKPSEEDKALSNSRTEFCEQDQENLYKLVQDKATTGKKGLGTGDRTQKVGGAHFKGQKKVFGDDDDDGSDGSKPEKEPGTGNGCSKDLLKEDDKPKKRKRDRGGGNEGTVQEGSKIKLKELISQILTQAPEQRMSVKRLQKRVIATTGLFSNATEDQVDSFKDKLLKSSRFVVEGKKVSLAAIKPRT